MIGKHHNQYGNPWQGSYQWVTIKIPGYVNSCYGKPATGKNSIQLEPFNGIIPESLDSNKLQVQTLV